MPGLSLPVIPRDVIDHSIGSQVNDCERKALYRYFYNRTPWGEDTTSTSWGTAYHKYREVLDRCNLQANEYKPDLFHQLALTTALQGFVDPPETHKKNYLDTMRFKKSCLKAFEKWKQETESGAYKIIQTECSFKLPLPSGRHYGGRFDQLYEWNDRLWVKDYKTCSYEPATKKEKYDMNHQMSGYVWAAQQLSGRQVDGVLVEILYNIQNKGPLIIPILTTRSTDEIGGFIEWAESQWDKVERAFETGRWSMNTNSCGDFFRKCEFWGACHPHGNNWDEVEGFLETKCRAKTWDYTNPED